LPTGLDQWTALQSKNEKGANISTMPLFVIFELSILEDMSNIQKSGRNNPNYRHGLSRHPLVAIHCQMLARCNNVNHPRYSDYGGRGITVCQEWKHLPTFYKWCMDNGWIKRLQIDRKDNDGNYCPDNCRIVEITINQRNKRNNRLIEYTGETKTLSEWCSILNLNYSVMLTRLIRHNPTPEVLFETPNRYAKHKAKIKNIADGITPEEGK
jgi:hypothetical protein